MFQSPLMESLAQIGSAMAQTAANAFQSPLMESLAQIVFDLVYRTRLDSFSLL